MSKAATREASSDWPGSTLSTWRYDSSARSISPFSSSAMPSTKCVNALALRSPSGRKARSAAGLKLRKSSCRSTLIGADDGLVRGDTVRGVRASPTLAATRKPSVKKQHNGQRARFLCSFILSILAFSGAFSKPAFVRAVAGLPLGRQT